MVAHILSLAVLGFDGKIVEIEADSARGLPNLQIVGLGNKAIDEAKERVRSAIKNSDLDYPKTKITINMAPAELPKDGAHFDMAIALAILTVSGQIKQSQIGSSLFAGELALDGSFRQTKGAIHFAEACVKHGIKQLFISEKNAHQAQLIQGVKVIAVKDLRELFLHLKGIRKIVPLDNQADHREAPEYVKSPTIDDIKGQMQAKRALLIAAAGRHNILLSGPPGAGKSMLAKALRSLLPRLSDEEAIVVTKIHTIGGEDSDQILMQRPFRAPHHTASSVSLIGGGKTAKPGEISLAHLGVLFLDEMPEYSRGLLESLRQPLEDREISIDRANYRVTYPADFMLVGTMNPCPCGFLGDESRECSCSQTQILLYKKKISGPLLDRIDLFVEVSMVPPSDLLTVDTLNNQQQEIMQRAILLSQKTQALRYGSSKKYNSNATNKNILSTLCLSASAQKMLDVAAQKMSLSARSYFKILKIARTIADLESSVSVEVSHISEALQYRQK